MPSIVVKHLSDLAEKKGIARRDPIFQIYVHVIVPDDEPRDGLPSMPTRNIYDDMHDILESLPVEEGVYPAMPVPMADLTPNMSASVEGDNPVPVIPGLEEGGVLADTADDMVPKTLRTTTSLRTTRSSRTSLTQGVGVNSQQSYLRARKLLLNLPGAEGDYVVRGSMDTKTEVGRRENLI